MTRETGFARIDAGEVSTPLKIVTTGGSVSVFVTPRHSRREGTYGELLPRLLGEHGIAATTTHSGQWFDMIHNLRRRYEHGVRNQFPDVLVLNYGMAECQPNWIPTGVARHFQTWDVSSSPAAVAYRQRMARPVWKRLRDVQQAAARRTPGAPYRLSPQRFAGELTKVITMARDEVRPLVLVLDLDPPGERFEHWLPGMAERRELYQRVLADTVDRLRETHGDEVRLVRASETVATPERLAALLPDGIHRNAEGHRITANLLLDEILRWLKSDPS